jgi:putative transcriptional regulator
MTPTPPAELDAPLFLLAMPQVADPFFHKSVVLLLQHQDEGSFGFIVNRPTGVKLKEILEGMNLPWQGPEAAEAFLGGPVQPQLGSVLFGHLPGSKALDDGQATSEVLPGVSLTQHVGDLEQLAQAPPDRMRLLLGYSAWGAGQLVDEILRNDWILAPVQPELIFATEPTAVWDRALASVGIDPATLPSWTPSDDGAN